MKEYRKFLLLSSPRSGTHMLKTSLESHPNIVCLTEMFNPDYIKRKYSYDDNMPAQKVLNKFIYYIIPDCTLARKEIGRSRCRTSGSIGVPFTGISRAGLSATLFFGRSSSAQLYHNA